MIKLESQLFVNAGENRDYDHNKKSAQYDDVVANDLNKMTKKTAV